MRASDGENLLEVDSDLVKVVQLRDPGARGRIEREIESHLLAYLGMDYAARSRMVQFPPRPVGGLALRIAARFRKRSPIEGLIRRACCSELVDRVFQDCGIKIVDASVNLISPATIVHSELLEDVPLAIRDAPPSIVLRSANDPNHILGYIGEDVMGVRFEMAVEAARAGPSEQSAHHLERDLDAAMRTAGADLLMLSNEEKQLKACGLL